MGLYIPDRHFEWMTYLVAVYFCQLPNEEQQDKSTLADCYYYTQCVNELKQRTLDKLLELLCRYEHVTIEERYKT